MTVTALSLCTPKTYKRYILQLQLSSMALIESVFDSVAYCVVPEMQASLSDVSLLIIQAPCLQALQRCVGCHGDTSII